MSRLLTYLSILSILSACLFNLNTVYAMLNAKLDEAQMESRLLGNTMEYYSAIKRNSFESVLMRWMKLELIIQSEVSQKDKDHYSILTHIYGI